MHFPFGEKCVLEFYGLGGIFVVCFVGSVGHFAAMLWLCFGPEGLKHSVCDRISFSYLYRTTTGCREI